MFEQIEMIGGSPISLHANELSNGWTSREIDGNGGSVTVVGEKWRFLVNRNWSGSVFLVTCYGRGLMSIYRRLESVHTRKRGARRR
jgi:hypothetical protein